MGNVKASFKETANTTLANLSAVQTLLHNYPVLNTTSTFLKGDNVNCMSFMLDILSMFGITHQDVIEWVSKLLVGKGTDGFLVGVEWAVKGILLANIKNMFSCTLNPFLPDMFMYPVSNLDIKVKSEKFEEKTQSFSVNGSGYTVSLAEIDMYNILRACPTSNDGKNLYFDNTPEEGFTPNTLWKSTDFNAYLWYVINRGDTNTSNDSQEYKLWWDNRNRVINELRKLEEDGKKNILHEYFEGSQVTGNGTPSFDKRKMTKVEIEGTEFRKYPIIKCQYIERDPTGTTGDKLVVYINPYRYATRYVNLPVYSKQMVGSGFKVVKTIVTTRINTTIFEFNKELVLSMKLFDAKTVVANVVNAILGLSESFNFGISLNKELIEGMVGTVVEKIINTEDTVDDCYFDFSNDEYNDLLEKARLKHKSNIALGGDTRNVTTVDYDAINQALNNISKSTTLVEQQTAIANVFRTVAQSIAPTPTTERISLEFSFGSGVIQTLLKETIVQIVLQVLSPKVMLLYKLNGAIMGTIDPQDPNFVSFDGFNEFMKNFQNLLKQIAKQIYDLILAELKAWLIAQITPIIQAFALKLIMETIQAYRRLIQELIDNCTFGWWHELAYKYSNTRIDNVQYADIVPTTPKPNKNTCE